MKDDIIIFDTETTGLLNPTLTKLYHQPRLTEIYCLKVNKKLKKVDEFYTLINPQIPIPNFITRITGIDDFTVANAPVFKKVFKPLKKFLENTRVIVAHNLPFDLRMLEIEAARLNKKIKFPKEKFCTIEKSMFMKGYRLKNNELYELVTGRTEIKGGSHRAKNDVLATFENYKYLIEPRV